MTQYYPPETGAPQNRLHDLAKRALDLGIDVEVLTAMPSYPVSKIFPEYRGLRLKSETIDQVRVHRVNLFVPAKQSFLRRLMNYFSFALSAAWRGPRMISKPDVILMESPPLFLGFAAIYLKKKLGAKLVVNISDLWPKTPVDMGLVESRFIIWISYKLEAWLYEAADLITGQTQGIIDDIKSRFSHKSFHLFPNGVDLTFEVPPSARDQTRNRFGWSAQDLIVGYTGVIGHAQALDQILDAAKLVEAQTSIRFVFFGDGPERERLENRVRAESLKNISFLGHVPSQEIRNIQAGFDLGLVALSNAKVFEGARPSKMFEYMALGLPILYCGRGEGARLLTSDSEAPAGVVCPPENPLELSRILLEIYEKPVVLKTIGSNARNLAKRFDREIIARELVEVLTKFSADEKRLRVA